MGPSKVILVEAFVTEEDRGSWLAVAVQHQVNLSLSYCTFWPLLAQFGLEMVTPRLPVHALSHRAESRMR